MQQLGSSKYQLIDGSTSGSSDSSGSSLTDFVTLHVDLGLIASANLSFSGHIIQGVCDGAQNINPMVFEKTSSCDVEVDIEENQLILHNCTVGMFDEGDFDIITRNCSNCFELYILGE